MSKSDNRLPSVWTISLQDSVSEQENVQSKKVNTASIPTLCVITAPRYSKVNGAFCFVVSQCACWDYFE